MLAVVVIKQMEIWMSDQDEVEMGRRQAERLRGRMRIRFKACKTKAQISQEKK